MDSLLISVFKTADIISTSGLSDVVLESSKMRTLFLVDTPILLLATLNKGTVIWFYSTSSNIKLSNIEK